MRTCTHFTRNKEASAIHLPETRLHASTERKPLPAHGALASFSSENPVVVLHRHQPPNQKARAVCAENTHTGVVPLASAPAVMTTIMQMMTKVVTQRSTVLQSIWPQFTIRKLQSTAPQRWWEQFMCYYPWIITFHSFARHQWTYSIQRAIV